MPQVSQYRQKGRSYNYIHVEGFHSYEICSTDPNCHLFVIQTHLSQQQLDAVLPHLSCSGRNVIY